MNQSERSTMQAALDALEAALSDDKPYIDKCNQAIDKLRAALAQPEQVEPVAWMHNGKERFDVCHSKIKQLLIDAGLTKQVEHYTIPCYATPQSTVQAASVKTWEDRYKETPETGGWLSTDAIQRQHMLAEIYELRAHLKSIAPPV